MAELDAIPKLLEWAVKTEDMIIVRNICGLLAIISSERVARDVINKDPDSLTGMIRRINGVVDMGGAARDSRLAKLSSFVVQLQENLSSTR